MQGGDAFDPRVPCIGAGDGRRKRAGPIGGRTDAARRSADPVTTRRTLLSAAGLLGAFGWLPASAQTALLEITGEVRNPLALNRVDLLALARTDYSEQRTVLQDGKKAQLGIRYQGVPLTSLLDRAGPMPDRRAIRKAIVLLTARDGYQASFSWGELYNSALGDGVFVVLRVQNEELLDSDGLPALRSLQDTRSGPRHVRWLTRIELQLPVSR